MPRSLGKEQMTKSAVAGTVKFKSLHKWNKLQTGWNTWKMSGQCKKDRLSWTRPDLMGNVMTVRLPVMTSSTRVIFVMLCWLSYKPINNLITTHCPVEWTKGGQWPTLTWTRHTRNCYNYFWLWLSRTCLDIVQIRMTGELSRSVEQVFNTLDVMPIIQPMALKHWK